MAKKKEAVAQEECNETEAISEEVGNEIEAMPIEVTDEQVTELVSLSRIIKVSQEQINSLLTDWQSFIYKAYKTNGNDLKISIGLHLKGGTEICNIKSSLAFITSKITDERNTEINLNQPELFVPEQ